MEALAALKASLLAHLDTPLADGSDYPGALAKLFDDWPEPDERLEYPSISIDDPFQGLWVGHYPKELKLTQPVDPSDPNLTALWSVGTITMPFQIDVWARSSSKRAAVMESIRKSLRSPVPDGGQVRVAMTDLFGVIASYRIASTGFDADTPADVLGRVWRGEIIVEASCSDVVEATHPRFIEIRTNFDLCISQAIIAPPKETRVHFAP